MSKLEEIKARVEDLPSGPWRVNEIEGTVRTRDDEIMFDRSGYGTSYWNSHGRRRGEFIAHARTDIPKLIAALEAVEAYASNLECSSLADYQSIAHHVQAIITEALK